MWFEAISSLRINLEKSKLISIGELANMEELLCYGRETTLYVLGAYIGNSLKVNEG